MTEAKAAEQSEVEVADAGIAAVERNPVEAFELRPNGVLLFDNIVIGGMAVKGDSENLDAPGRPVVWLNLGWLKAAGLGVQVMGDPDVDRTRSGLVLER